MVSIQSFNGYLFHEIYLQMIKEMVIINARDRGGRNLDGALKF